eukprot:61256-Prorocentrum_minimum.AAC.2
MAKSLRCRYGEQDVNVMGARPRRYGDETSTLRQCLDVAVDIAVMGDETSTLWGRDLDATGTRP